jgi:hypothetical protein
MSGRDHIEQASDQLDDTFESDNASLLQALVERSVQCQPAPAHKARRFTGVVIGELLAIADNGETPLVVFPGQIGTAAVRARAVVDLHGAHTRKAVVLMFESGDPSRPIVIGVLRGAAGWPLDERPGQVQVDADGERLLVSAKEQLVLRCGKASITLTKAGKVLIQGENVSSRSTGVNRVKGASIQLN